MKTVKELNDDILKMTMTINEHYPELSKFLEEMPDTIPNVANPHMDRETLLKYHESLVTLMQQYEVNHHD
jgi:hypothetical protein